MKINGLIGFGKALLKIGIAGGIVWYLIAKTGAVEKFHGAFTSQMNVWWLIPAIVLYGFHIFVNAWRWWLLLKVRQIPCSLFSAVSLTMQSFFFSLVMPGGALGGDVVRAGFIAARMQKGQRFDGVFTILIDRFTGMIGIFSLALILLPFCWNTIASADGTAALFSWLLVAGCAAGIVVAIGVFEHRKLEQFSFFKWCRNLVDKITGGTFSKVMDALDCYDNAKKEIMICILASLIGVNLTLAAVMYCVCMAVSPVGSSVSFGAALTAITIGNIAGLLPVTPSGVGLRDYFVVMLLTAGGFQGDPLVSSLIMTALILGWNLSGGIFFLIDPGKKIRMELPDSAK